MALLMIYLKEMSIDAALLYHASSNSRENLFVPDTEMMAKLGVTNVRETPNFSGWTIESHRSGAVVTGKLSGGFTEDQQITFFCRANSPGKVYMLASWQYDSRGPDDDRAIRSAIWGSSVSIGGRVVRQAATYDSIADAHVNPAGRWFLTYILNSEEFEAGLKAESLTLGLTARTRLVISALISRRQ